MTQQPILTSALVRAAQTVIASLDGDGNAPSTWVHAGAVAQHATRAGLTGPGALRQQLTNIAELHDRLTYWGNLADQMTTTTETAITNLWTEHDLWSAPDPHDRILWHSYPLGDLYQALSVEAVKGRAMCQTPWWVSRLLLEISYRRAVEVWDNPQVIDPSCGTGHVLIESYMAARAARTMARRWPDNEACLDAVHGVDIDPHASATAAYRLVALASANRRGGSVADLPVHVAPANSLLAKGEPILQRGRYHVVVANPPYIVCRDPETNAAIRARYPETAYRQYSLALPFHQLMMELLVPGGWCAQLTANSFMKREFGKKYVENWLPQWDAQWIIDTSGAYIPGHGTPTVIMCHRKQAPTSDTIRVVQGIRGEPSAPSDPAEGVVWGEIARLVRDREMHERFVRRSAGAQEQPPESAPEPERPMVQPTLFEVAA